eukprot:TRINITY_DN102793_c0_g1_i1.p1 TRINITY_DN102793_c0_g1~~TRINITY_DN102793_c0_g1_i1.p1  ORF type:complete len:340 (+),score=69.15 TRINITY_DN102793_c0_g1_i1:45-1022(+)
MGRCATLHDRRLRNAMRFVAGVILCCVGLASLKITRSQLQLAATVAPLSLRGSDADSDAALSGCAAAFQAGSHAFLEISSKWESAFLEGVLLPNLGKSAERGLHASMDAFDRELVRQAMPGRCASERTQLEAMIKKTTSEAMAEARLLALDIVGDELKESLLKLMRRRKGPLRVREKVALLKDAVESFKNELRRMTPAWVTVSLDPETMGDAERQLGEAERGVEASREGLVLQQQWQLTASDELLSKRAHGVTVSLDPELRLMVRPDGIGSFQLFGSGPVGPPNQAANVNLGVINDGTISDVYREHPEPPLVAMQPAVKVNVNVR